jgi:hypothetical protein
MGITYPSSHPVNPFHHAGAAKNHAEWWLCFLGLDHNNEAREDAAMRCGAKATAIITEERQKTAVTAGGCGCWIA